MNNLKEKKIRWKMSPETFLEYLRIGATMFQAEPFSEEYREAVDELRNLPGYPLEYEMHEGETLQPVIVTPAFSVVH